MTKIKTITPTCNLNSLVLFEVWLTCEVAFLCWLEVYRFVFFLWRTAEAVFTIQLEPDYWSFCHEATSSLTVG